MGNRYARDNRPWVKPVERIELDDKNSQKKIIVIILLLVIALACFGYSISQLLKVDKGWTVITVNPGVSDSCGDDFTLNYFLGNGDTPTTVEKKAITLIYTNASVNAYKMFNADASFDDVISINYINNHPNEIIEVDPYLYESFELIKSKGNRNIYLGPIYQMYDDIFYLDNPGLINEFDPLTNLEVKELYKQISGFAKDETMIDVQLLGNNQICLKVSSEYQKFIEENSLENLIDFFWMKNSFIIDYLADCLVKDGYDLGVITSFNGFVANLYDQDIVNKYSAFDLNSDGKIYQAFDFALSGKVNMVYYHNYQIDAKEFIYVTVLEDGSVRNSYLSVDDGLQKNPLENLLVYSYNKSNAEVLLDTIDNYLSDSFDKSDALSLTEKKIQSIFFDGNIAKYTDGNLRVDSIFNKEDVNYQVELLK